MSAASTDPMGHVYDEFERELHACQQKYAGQPKKEILRLSLLALEREEIVSIGYREDRILPRLRTMPVPEEVKDLIRRALIWAWKDEEMHAIYLRGAILKFRNPALHFLAFLRQAGGAIGGWAGSVRQHVRWREAPFSRAVATLLTWLGSLSGRVSANVRAHLRYRSFRDFCLFNIDAEKTAWLCFKHIADLASRIPDTPDLVIGDFRRMQDDEDRHRRIFQILADSLEANDQLATGVTADTLAQKIASVGEVFLPRHRRPASADNTLGAGGQVWVAQGMKRDDKLSLFAQMLDRSDLKERLAERARVLSKPVSELRIAIKPSFMLGYHRKDPSAITDPAVLVALAQYLQAQRCANISIVEQRNLYDHFYKNRTVQDVARYFNIASPYFTVVDASEEEIPHTYSLGLGQYFVGRTWKEADFRISFGKLRSHPVEMVYLTVANLEGLGARCDEFLFVDRQAERNTATMMLMAEFPPHFAILDAYEHSPDGLLGIMGCPRPKSPYRFYAGDDPISVDIVAARHLGLNDPRKSGTLRTACYWFGDPSQSIEVIGTDEPIEGWRSPYHNEWSTLLSLLAYPVYQFGSGRGAVFVPEMDEEAFPPVIPEGIILRARRRSLQVLLGLRYPK